MTKLLDDAIEKVRELTEEDQDAIAVAVLSMAAADASKVPYAVERLRDPTTAGIDLLGSCWGLDASHDFRHKFRWLIAP
jgi:hypothetical protein